MGKVRGALPQTSTSNRLRADAADLVDELGALVPDVLFPMLTAIRRFSETRQDEFSRYQAAEAVSQIIYPKYKFSEFGRICLEDADFIDFYRRFMDVDNWHSFDRKYTLLNFLKLTSDLDGDLAECGVYAGASAYLMCKSFQKTDKMVHLFDSFEGLSQPEAQDGDYWKRGALSMPVSVVSDNLSEFKNYSIYKGWIPDRFEDVAMSKFCFVHVDVDLYQPTFDCLEFFYPRLVPRGVMLMDDYGFNSCPGAKKAADRYFSDKDEIVMLPTGQAVVIKS